MSSGAPLDVPARQRLGVLWLIPVALAAHNAEEAIAFPHYLGRIRAALPPVMHPIASRVEIGDLWLALVLVTIIPLAIVAWAETRPTSLVARWCALTVQAVVALNVLSHVLVAALLLRGYAPGLATALVVNVPLSLAIFRRAATERWLPPRGWWWMAPAALLLHGPGLIGLLLLV